MNKRILILLALCCLVLAGCGKKQNQIDQDSLNAAILGVSNSGEGVRILSTGTVDDNVISNDMFEIQLEKYEVGYGKTNMNFDIPAFLMTFKLTNNSSETVKVNQICSPKIYVDGVSQSPNVGNIFADKFNADITSITDMKAGASVTYYEYVHIDDIEAKHTVEIEFDGYTWTIETE